MDELEYDDTTEANNGTNSRTGAEKRISMGGGTDQNGFSKIPSRLQQKGKTKTNWSNSSSSLPPPEDRIVPEQPPRVKLGASRSSRSEEGLGWGPRRRGPGFDGLKFGLGWKSLILGFHNFRKPPFIIWREQTDQPQSTDQIQPKSFNGVFPIVHHRPRKEWTRKEDFILYLGSVAFHHSWVQLSVYFPERNPSQLKQRRCDEIR